MKTINLLSLVNAKTDLSEESFQEYIRTFKLNPKMRASELADVAILIEHLQEEGAKTKHFNEFFVGYSIHRISKEFDLLRFGSNFILNIELKLESTEERIVTQLLQNAHYLRFLNRPIFNFTFVTKTKMLYKLHKGKLVETTMAELFEMIDTQQVMSDIQIDELFDPINYLISPLDEPTPFMKNEYFLTAQQTTFKMEMMNRSSQFRQWIALEGGPGTGKTLLTYDIAKEYMKEGKSVTLVHCRPLSKGQYILGNKYGWDIVYINNWNDSLNCDVLIVDEAHELTRAQLQQILNFEQRFHPKIILSYDPQHYLNGARIIEEAEKRVKLIRFELKVILQLNKEIHTFINCLFNLNYPTDYTGFKNISVQYFSKYEDAVHYLSSLQSKNWKIINVVKDLKLEELSITNDLIGQEFDNVAALLNEHFYYKANDRLSSFGIHYTYEQPSKVLFQSLARTRKKLELVIVNNEPLLKNILSIINP